MTTRKELLDAVVAQIADYREGEIPAMNATHVDRWVKQFPGDTQDPLLAELAHVFSKTYFTRKNVKQFLNAIVAHEKLTDGDPAAFWKNAGILNIQTAGNSQRDMLAVLDKALQKTCGMGLAQCGNAPVSSYVYIDDALFSGGRIKHDIIKWIREAAPQKAKLHIITIAYHRLGQWRTETDIKDAIKEEGKSIELSWWRVLEIEDRKKYIDNSDVLRPTAVPADHATAQYVAGLKLDPVFRAPGQLGALGFFSSDAGRSLLEQQFLVSGVRVRALCPHLNTYMRPLGNSMMGTTGFGSMIVTYRNCPNNAPLVLWAGDPWYPLFPRKTN
ncbi:hypothetical protein SAMN03159496_01129 [Rhizobium sp. NFR07]|nr:hypothetical protein SAMN03159496_01129 [Rhizobium sp. NFR07]